MKLPDSSSTVHQPSSTSNGITEVVYIEIENRIEIERGIGNQVKHQ